MPYSVLDPLVGVQQIALFGLPDTTARVQTGLIVTDVDNYWGAGEFMYVKANGSIRQGGIVALNPAVSSGAYAMLATEVTNTTIMGRPVGVAMTSMTTGQFGWICI